MLILHLKDKERIFKKGEVVTLRINKLRENTPGYLHLEAEEIKYPAGTLPVSYACNYCLATAPAAEDGGLPEGWVEHKFEEGSHWACTECKENPFCHVCGCTEFDPCPEGCGWANEEQTLCTACVTPKK